LLLGLLGGLTITPESWRSYRFYLALHTRINMASTTNLTSTLPFTTSKYHPSQFAGDKVFLQELKARISLPNERAIELHFAGKLDEFIQREMAGALAKAIMESGLLRYTKFEKAFDASSPLETQIIYQGGLYVHPGPN